MSSQPFSYLATEESSYRIRRQFHPMRSTLSPSFHQLLEDVTFSREEARVARRLPHVTRAARGSARRCRSFVDGRLLIGKQNRSRLNGQCTYIPNMSVHVSVCTPLSPHGLLLSLLIVTCCQ